ncbi:MAG: glutaminyl-peptide cyclotransferase [Verrucomicrobiota bacterium]
MRISPGRNPRHLLAFPFAIGGALFSAACDREIEVPQRLTYELVATYPHQTDASTQGLLLHKGVYYESTGGYGESSLRRVDPETGEVLKRRFLPTKAFGEGLALREDRLYQLEWKSGTGFVYDRETFERISEFSYEGEGWGFAWDGTHFILSDGTSTLRFLNPDTFEVAREVTVSDHRGPVDLLNELEWIDGKVWANRWHTDQIVVIHPRTGVIEASLHLAALERPRPRDPESVLNGIAFDPETGLLHVTGKRWPHVHVLRVEKQ